MNRSTRLAAIVLAVVLVRCEAQQNTHWLGYVEGEMALIAPPQPGWITSVEVARGTEVKVGDPLFTLDAVREIAARDNARATITAAQEQAQQASAQIARARAEEAQVVADIEKSQKELQRQQGLVQSGASPRRDLEAAQAAFDSARARRSQATAQQTQGGAARRQAEAQARAAEATLMSAEFNLSQRTVNALVSGQVQDIYYRQGEYANGGAPVIALLPPANVFVRFFVPETAVASLRLGEMVHISCDGCATDLVGTVSFIAAQSEFTPPVIYSVGNRERLVFKAEARVAMGLPFRPGLPVEVWREEATPSTQSPP
jgi:HlyD family secretion protein